MTYRHSGFEPGHVEPKAPDVRPYDAWQKLGLAAFALASLLLLLDVASWFGLPFERDYPGTLILLAIGGTILMGYRSKGGLLASKAPEFRRMLGLGIAAPGMFLALLELVG